MPGLQIRVGKLGTQLRRSAVRGLEWGTKKSRRVLEEEEQTRMLFLRRERSEKGSGSGGFYLYAIMKNRPNQEAIKKLFRTAVPNFIFGYTRMSFRPF